VEKDVKTKTLIAAMMALAGVTRVHSADQGDVKTVLEKLQSIRPTEAELALYQLDWMPTLEAARQKAAKEDRPIFLVVVTNSFGDLYSGHC
jgi:hypothetical protein